MYVLNEGLKSDTESQKLRLFLTGGFMRKKAPLPAEGSNILGTNKESEPFDQSGWIKVIISILYVVGEVWEVIECG